MKKNHFALLLFVLTGSSPRIQAAEPLKDTSPKGSAPSVQAVATYPSKSRLTDSEDENHIDDLIDSDTEELRECIYNPEIDLRMIGLDHRQIQERAVLECAKKLEKSSKLYVR